MKSSRKFVCTALLSIGIIISSFAPNFALEGKNSDPNVSLTNVKADSGFKSGKLTEKSNETPEKIVEKYYSKDSAGKSKKEFKKDKEFKNSLGRTVIKTKQTYNGVVIYGTEQNYHVDKDGVIVCVVGSNVDDIADKLDSSVVPAKCSQESLLAVIEKDLGYKPVYTKATQSELVLFPSNGIYKYAYKINVSFDEPTFNDLTYYIDANDFSVLNVDNMVFSVEQPAVGTGIGQSGSVIQNLKMVSDNNTYYLKNTVENLKTVNSSDLLFSEPDSFFNSGTSTNYQTDAVDAHNNATKVTDFFNNCYPFCRNGNDDLGSEIKVQILDNNDEFNAWGSTNLMKFGVGEGAAGKSFAYALDCVAHEYTHGMLYSEGLDGTSTVDKENWSLHEGISDVFAVICEYFITHNGTPDWVMGEDTGTTFRNCAYPQIDDYSDYKNYLGNHGTIDPHIGGGVITKAAYLIAVGGTHNDCSVTGIGYLDLAEIFYPAINDGYLIPQMKFHQFASAVLDSAKTRFGADSSEAAAVSSAFNAVGFGLKSTSVIIGEDIGWQLDWLGTVGSTYGIYRRYTDSTAEPVKVAETTNTSIIVDVPAGSYDFFVAEVNSSGNRISSFSNPAKAYTYSENPVQNFTMASRVLLQVGFSWTGETGKRYAIFRKPTASDMTPVKVEGTETTNSSITITTLIGCYDYYVMKVDSSGNRICYESDRIEIETNLSAPTNFVLTSSDYSKLNFSWTYVSGARYGIYSKLVGATGDPVKVAETTSGSITVYKLIGSYEFYVARIDSAGYRTSEFSDPVTV